jgi:hypothetical protein
MKYSICDEREVGSSSQNFLLQLYSLVAFDISDTESLDLLSEG